MDKISQRFPKVWNHYSNCGNARKTAIAVVDELVRRICGVHMSELEDSPELCNILDTLQESIESNDSEYFLDSLISDIKSVIKNN